MCSDSNLAGAVLVQWLPLVRPGGSGSGSASVRHLQGDISALGHYHLHLLVLLVNLGSCLHYCKAIVLVLVYVSTIVYCQRLHLIQL